MVLAYFSPISMVAMDNFVVSPCFSGAIALVEQKQVAEAKDLYG